MKSFGSKELCKCLENLGFQRQPQKATSHIKYKIPSGKKIPCKWKPFIVVQLGRKNYDNHSSTRYMRQIINLGFDINEIIKKLG